MVVYIIILFLTITVYLAGKETKSLLSLYFLNIFLFFILGFRGENVGMDTLNYHTIFDNIVSGEAVFITEYGYVLLTRFVAYLGGTQQLIILLYSAITIYFFTKFYLKYSLDPFLSMLIFVFVGPFFLASFNQLRQYCAIAIFLGYLLPLIEQRKFLQFIVSSLVVAFFTHFSIIFVLPLYFVLCKNWSIISRFTILFFSILGLNIIVILVLRTPYAYFIYKRSDIGVNNSLFIVHLIITTAILLFEKRFKKNNRHNIVIFFNMAFLTIVCTLPVILRLNIAPEIFIRINNYFFPYIIILIPEIVTLFDFKSRALVRSNIIIILVLYYLRNILIMGATDRLVPYEFNFNIFNIS